MYFYQIDRINLTKKVNRYSDRIRGRTLDVGAGPHKRYAFHNITEYIRMDMENLPHIDVVGVAEDMPFPEASFDSVVCTQTLVDIFEPMKAFKEFSRVLKPNGHLLLTTPFLLDRQDSPYQNWHPTDNALRKLCTENGLEVSVLEGCGGYHSAMFQLRSRYFIRKYKLKDYWFSRGISFIFRVFGTIAIYRDEHGDAEMRKHYTDNWFLLAKKA
jgi:SAM-dependent methyltransferase